MMPCVSTVCARVRLKSDQQQSAVMGLKITEEEEDGGRR